ncbi:nuclear transport factor 2 family protein [Nocardia sp. NBC_00565]|uniref:nuclear transport factor 2 family protein n=1 Tax=Nocardia sp. NBC_00565 TaxID=2975993 RepID=UPI002E811B11|nr:nuclear transport factor 2 family protein [Nocardia sp. NBC_00565]WUC05191.1 nuclear transport factor 2 family protein [Nocardia sp. NBC_00565]
MALSVQDRIEIGDLIALHGHLMDAGELDRMDELFTAGITYDLNDFGRGELRGILALREAAVALGGGNPVGHHITNVVITETDGAVRVRSKGIGIHADGTSRSVEYDDLLVREAAGWRISYRKVILHQTPLGGRVTRSV